LRKSNKDFSYTIFPVKKINVGKVLKLRENGSLIILSIHILKLEISRCDRTPFDILKKDIMNMERLVFLNLDAKLWVPSKDTRNIQMVILMITRVRKRMKVPL
jgi:hypothetical protein